jgi:hypothetical protein
MLGAEINLPQSFIYLTKLFTPLKGMKNYTFGINKRSLNLNRKLKNMLVVTA